MRRKYIIITVLAITCGAGATSWLAANYISSCFKSATHLTAMALSAAEEKAKAAELALGISEAAERFARDELAQETRMRIAAEQALDMAIIRTAQTARALAEQGKMRNSFEGNSPDAEITKEELVLALAAQGTTKKATEAKLEDLDTILLSLDEMIAKQVAARRKERPVFDSTNTKVQLADSSQLQQVTTTKPRTKHTGGRITSKSTPRQPQTWWQRALPDL